MGSFFYAGLVCLASVMFGVQFSFNQRYQKNEGTAVKIGLLLSAMTGICQTVIMGIIGNVNLRVSLFSVLIAALYALNGILNTYFGIKALSVANLSVFSLFSMLGGMMLPFISGFVFWQEKLTVPKLICFVLIAAALFLCTDRKKTEKNAYVYYAAVFVTNGLVGVLSGWHQKNETAVPSVSFSFWIGVCMTVFASVGFVLATGGKERPKLLKPRSSVAFGVIAGTLNSTANFLLLIALVKLDASLQYPLVTGVTMIVATVISLLHHEKVGVRTIAATAVAFLATLVLVF